MREISLPSRVRSNLGKGDGLFVLLIGAVIVLQLRGGLMSPWVRKTVSTDRRSLAEAMTESRFGVMEYSLWEFRRNPLFGSGFQVADTTRDLLKETKGLVVSAPIEKGILPVMVLGETGIVGEFFFLVFLLTFYGVCSKRRYYITITTFSVFLATNLGEATFFSPGGGGGIFWMISCVGGFALDTTLIYRQKLARDFAALNLHP